MYTSIYNKLKLVSRLLCIFTLVFLLTVCSSWCSTFPSSVIAYTTVVKSGKPSHLVLYYYPKKVLKVLIPNHKEDVTVGEAIRDPVFSPDGRKILFSANRNNSNSKITKTGNFFGGLDLWLMDIDRSKAKSLTNDSCGYEKYTWSPNGKYICAISYNGVWDNQPMADEGQRKYLYFWNIKKPVKKLIGLDANDYIWSVDGMKIYHDGYSFSVNQLKNRRLCLIRFDISKGRSSIYYSTNNDTYLGYWSPNGKFLALCESNKTGYNISILSKKNKILSRFLNTNLPVRIMWSHDGNKIAYVESIPHQRNGEYLQILKVLDIRSGLIKELFSLLGEITLLGWTKDNCWVVNSCYKSNSTTKQQEVIALSTDKTKIKITLLTPDANVTSFDWHEVK